MAILFALLVGLPACLGDPMKGPCKNFCEKYIACCDFEDVEGFEEDCYRTCTGNLTEGEQKNAETVTCQELRDENLCGEDEGTGESSGENSGENSPEL